MLVPWSGASKSPQFAVVWLQLHQSGVYPGRQYALCCINLPTCWLLCPKLQPTQTCFPLSSMSKESSRLRWVVGGVNGVKISILTSTPSHVCSSFSSYQTPWLRFFPLSPSSFVQYPSFFVIHSCVSTDTSLPSRSLTTQGQQTNSIFLSEHSHCSFGT